jgi:Family of unknown function (DUF6011)
MEILQTLSNGMVLSRKGPEDHVPTLADSLLAECDRKLKPEEIKEEGSYFTMKGDVARVRKSKSTGYFYAELFDEAYMKFIYTKGLIYNLKSRMTMEEARAWGARVGHCCVCGKLLSANKSVDQGIGPVCILKI